MPALVILETLAVQLITYNDICVNKTSLTLVSVLSCHRYVKSDSDIPESESTLHPFLLMNRFLLNSLMKLKQHVIFQLLCLDLSNEIN